MTSASSRLSYYEPAQVSSRNSRSRSTSSQRSYRSTSSSDSVRSDASDSDRSSKPYLFIDEASGLIVRTRSKSSKQPRKKTTKYVVVPSTSSAPEPSVNTLATRLRPIEEAQPSPTTDLEKYLEQCLELYRQGTTTPPALTDTNTLLSTRDRVRGDASEPAVTVVQPDRKAKRVSFILEEQRLEPPQVVLTISPRQLENRRRSTVYVR